MGDPTSEPSTMPATLLPVLAGPFAGSFCGVLIARMSRGEAIGWSRSRCETCDHTLSPIDLVPIASYALRRGRCGWCGARIGRFHLYVELAATGVALWACVASPDAAQSWIASLLGWTLLTLAWIDWRSMVLPDVLTLPLLLAGLGVTALRTPEDLSEHALAAAIGYGGIALLAVVYERLRAREGIGLGDAKLFAAAGAWLGIEPMPWVLATAAGFGIVATIVRTRGAPGQLRQPFGPWLALAFWLFR